MTTDYKNTELFSSNSEIQYGVYLLLYFFILSKLKVT